MTAPALNLAQIAVPGVPGANSATGSQTGETASGFDALIAALAPTGEGAAAAMPAPSGEAETVEATAATGGEGALVDPAALVAMAALQLPPTTDAAPAATAKGGASDLPQPATAGSKARPFLLMDRNPPAVGAADDATATDAVAADGDEPQGPIEAPKTAPRADKPVPPAFGRDKAPGAPAQPALDNANAKADLAGKAAAADTSDQATTPPPPTEPPAVAATETAKTAAPPQAARAEPPAAKTVRTERKATVDAPDAPDAARPAEAAAKPAQAQAAQGTAKAASDTVEAVEPKAREAKTDVDASDATPQGDTRAASQSSNVSGPAAPAVRGAPETVANLAAQIVKKLEAKTTRFDVELDPMGLGRVDVRVEIGAHGKMTASMVFENPQAAHELKSRAAELQRALEQAGFDLAGGLSFDVADQGRQQGQAWQDQAETGLGFRGQAFRAALETAGEAADVANTGALRLRRGVNAGVDVRI